MSVVLRTIEAFPSGRSTGELLALLNVEFEARKRESIHAELKTLQQRGLIRLGRDGKWRLIARISRSSSIDHNMTKPSGEASGVVELLATPARFGLTAPLPSGVAASNDPDAKPDPQALLRYYRAAIRSDPRGALTQTTDNYGTTFLLLSGAGQPWPADDEEQGEIRVRLGTLPGSFREALSRRSANENALAVGWPITVSSQAGMPIIRPVGLLAAEWSYEGEELVVRLVHGDILVNPDWIRSSANATAWRAGDLEAVFRAAEGVGLGKEDFLERLQEAQASAIRGKLTGTNFAARLDLSAHGIFDALGLFLSTETSFTSGAVKDLDRIAGWTRERLAATALGPLLGLDSSAIINPVAPINLGPLNAEQIEAVELAMSRALTVVTGPPGTGKSQAIVAMVATSLHAGQTVLVASKNHQALDAVEERLAEIASGANFLVRTLNPATESDRDIDDVLKELVDQPAGPRPAADSFIAEQLEEAARQRQGALRTHAQRRALNLELADLLDRLELRRERRERLDPANSDRLGPWWQRLWRMLSPVRKGGTQEGGHMTEAPGGVPTNTRRLNVLAVHLRQQLVALPHAGDPFALTQTITELARTVVARSLTQRTAINLDMRKRLMEERDDNALAGELKLNRAAVECIIRHRPLWLASVLGAPRRIPLHEGLFDVVIFDEASQCDIGTALPLLARARRAVIVGDDRQLAFISQIGLAQDRNLMAAQDLPKRGMGRFAQGRKSLFDFASANPMAQQVMLRDQYRSAPDIVDYISTTFYGSQLRPSADPTGFRTPAGQLPGLVWTDVPGQGTATAHGHVNVAEVKQIAAHLHNLLVEQRYDGSVGVISPFRAQVLALEQTLRERLGPIVTRSADLRVATVDGFQGQERDLILFSPVLHAGSPASAVTFIQRDRRRLNVAISRARAVSHVFGDLGYARSGKVKVLAGLAASATEPRKRHTGETVFESKWERRVFHALKARGLDPVPQFELAGRRLDFALFAGPVRLDLEVDGRQWHQDIDGKRKVDDLWRDHQLRSLGWRVRRFWVDELASNLEGCLDTVERDLA